MYRYQDGGLGISAKNPREGLVVLDQGVRVPAWNLSS